MDIAAFWDEIVDALGVKGLFSTRANSPPIQALMIVVSTVWLAKRTRNRSQGLAIAGRAYAEVASVVTRALAFAIYGVGATLLLGLLGVNTTAIAAVLGAATIGSTLALQKVGRAFVNGIYILIERPYHIGDRNRNRVAEGRVEEIGVRLTCLTTHGGQRISVPNTLVFTSIVENASAGRIERRQFTVSGKARAIPDIKDATILTLKGAAHLSGSVPIVNILEAGPEGATAEITVEHDHGHLINDIVIDRLRTEFPEATITMKPVASIE